ncbi:SigE family RNA polymerase sigma factor [Kineococcus endophyticus]|uniref:SigE family RNA polymerase sigma factor n=1 Tax=Kineococcus endophyticus TaxID=1181883 RepID=A0ABV3PAG7_9ACTN
MNREEHFTSWAHEATPQLRRIARLLAGDFHIGEDLLQDVYARMYARWPRIQDPSAYARRALANAATSRWRHRSHRHEAVRDVDDHLAGADPSQPLVDLEQRADLLAVLRPLPPRQRAVIVLRYLDDRSDDQVADLLDISVGTVKSQASRALARLRQALPGRAAGEPPQPDRPSPEVPSSAASLVDWARS